MALDIDRHAHLASPLSRWDPRFKMVSLGLLILVVALLKTLPLAMAMLVFAVALLWSARLPWHFVTEGVKFVMIFLLPFLVVMPLTYPDSSASVPGQVFSWEGWRLGWLVVVKSLAIVLLGYAMFATGRFDVSMIALQRLKCPTLLVQMILFTYRYIFVFLAEMRRMDTAMKSRGFVKRPDRATLRTLGHFVGTLLVRSFERTERIYKAMLSKGYRGEFHTLVSFRAETMDVVKATVTVVLAAVVLAGDRWGGFRPAELGWF